MDFWIKAGQLILSLSILIVLHEMGHFFPARWFKTRVEKFYLFFFIGRPLLKYKKGETEYGIGWIPLGGYVKISGMIDESMDQEQMSKPAEPWEFRSKPAWQRLIIMVGGVVVNMIVGFLIYMMILGVWGQDYQTVNHNPGGFDVNPYMEQFELSDGTHLQDGDKVIEVEGEVILDMSPFNISKQILFRGARNFEVQHLDGSQASLKLPEDVDYGLFANDFGGSMAFTFQRTTTIDSVYGSCDSVGMLAGDSIVSIDGIPTNFQTDVLNYLNKQVEGEHVDHLIGVYRGGKYLEFEVSPTKNLYGVGFPRYIPEMDHKDYGFGEAIAGGFTYGYWTLHDYVSQMKFLFTSKGASSIGGFGAIGNMFGSTWEWSSFWKNTALLSIILAFMNILPIPALDGGHVLFLIGEIITGRPPSDKFLTRAQVVGMIILFSLLLYANGMDIYRWLFG